MEARDKALDGLRGIAILLVLATHLIRFDSSQPLILWINATLRAGWIGVDLFFVLSGFLITGILIRYRTQTGRARTFYLRRALRILPAYYAYVLLAAAVILGLGAPRVLEDSLRFLPALLLFGQNVVSAIQPDLPALRDLRHLWSLAVEEQFYLLWPWLVWRVRPSNLPRLCLLIVAVAWLSKLLLLAAGAQALTIYYLLPTRMDGFAIGALLAARLALGQAALPRMGQWVCAGAGLLLLLAFLRSRGLHYREEPLYTTLYTSLTPLLFGGLLAGVLSSSTNNSLRRLLGCSPLVFFGTYSYGIYLVHFAADTIVRAWLLPPLATLAGGNWLALGNASLSIALSVVLALLLYRLVEAPALRAKEKFPTGTDSRPVLLENA